MVLLQLSENNFWYDHGVAVVSAVVTLLAFLLTFGTLIYNSLKEKRESEVKSQKTLSMLDFLLENNNEKTESYLKQVSYIKENPFEGLGHYLRSGYKENDVEKWYKTRDKSSNIRFYTSYDHMKMKLPDYNPEIRTKFEKNYIVLETFRFLIRNEFLMNLDCYQKELKKNLENQHLNITSDSLEKISNKIHAIQDCESILDSMRIHDLLLIASLEEKETEDQISEHLGKDMHEFVEEDYEKISKLEEALEEVVKPLSDDNSF